MKWYKIILTLVWIIGTIIGMMYTYPFIWIIMVVCIIYPIVYSMLPVPIQDSIDKYVWGLAFLYVSSFAITIAALIIGVRVIEDGSTIKIVSPFYLCRLSYISCNIWIFDYFLQLLFHFFHQFRSFGKFAM